MKQFFKFMFASMVGFVLSIVFIFFILNIIIISIVSQFQKSEIATVSPNSILKISLNYDVKERSSSNPFEEISFLSFEAKKTLGLDDILANIKKAKTDNNIKGILLDVGYIPAQLATIEEIRSALINFKNTSGKSGTGNKFIYAYSEVYSQKGYYLVSVADKIFLNPTGILEFKGFSAEIMFYKHALEKLEIEPQVFYNGKFKSYTEPFRLDKMSEPNRIQTTEFLNEMYHGFIGRIAESRKLSEKYLDSVANNLLIRKAEDAKELKLVDELSYEDEMLDSIKYRLSIDEKKEIDFITMNKYVNVVDQNKSKVAAKERIAIIYAEGEIVDGKSDEGEVGSITFAKTIRDARLNDKVKAIVLRVNSPGGSALASDIIWREITLARKKKPVVVSMGGVAASGGYYISCAADTIVAEPNTLTGSIGVLGIIPNIEKFFNNKLGITFDGVKTSRFADMPTVTRPMSAEERQIVQMEVDRIYHDFVSKVAEGREKTVEEIDSIAQGRVWSAMSAKEIGLVDVIGGIDDAVKIAASMAKVEQYSIMSLPEQKDPVTKIIEQFTGDEMESRILKNKLGDNYKYVQQLERIKNMRGIQARIPFDLDIY